LSRDWSSDVCSSDLALRLEDLIKHAKETVPFYMGLNEAHELSDFPIINKNLIRDNFDDFRSSKYLEEPLVAKYTSGSTGTPFRRSEERRVEKENSAQ